MNQSCIIAAVQAVQGGNREAFAVVMTECRTRVAGLVARHVPPADVEGVIQDVFVSVYRALDRYHPSRPFEHWILRIATRHCCDYWRRLKRAGRLVSLDEWQTTHGEPAAPADTGRRQAQAAVEALLAGLSAEDRMLVSLLHLEEQTCRETADQMGRSMAWVKVRMFRLRSILRKRLVCCL